MSNEICETPLKSHCRIKLSPRQLEVLQLRADGYLNKQIADHLGIQEDTVKEHISAALRKLNVKSSAQAVVMLIRLDILR